MMKEYLMPNGLTYQYEAGKQPECAVEVKKVEKVETKAATPPNKARTVKTK